MVNARGDTDELPKKNEARINEVVERLAKLEAKLEESENQRKSDFDEIMAQFKAIRGAGKRPMADEFERSEVTGGRKSAQFPPSNQEGSDYEFRRSSCNSMQLKREQRLDYGCNEERVQTRKSSADSPMASLKAGHARKMKKLDDGYAKMQEILETIIEKLKGNEVTPKVNSVLNESAYKDDILGTEEADIKTDNTSEPLGVFLGVNNEECVIEDIDVFHNSIVGSTYPTKMKVGGEADEKNIVASENISSSDLVQELYKNAVKGCETIQDCDDVEIIEEKMNEREINSVIGVQNITSLIGLIHNAPTSFVKMSKNYYDVKNAITIGFHEAAGHHISWRRVGIHEDMEMGTTPEGVQALFVFDPGGCDLNFCYRPP